MTARYPRLTRAPCFPVDRLRILDQQRGLNVQTLREEHEVQRRRPRRGYDETVKFQKVSGRRHRLRSGVVERPVTADVDTKRRERIEVGEPECPLGAGRNSMYFVAARLGQTGSRDRR